jgi:hypothetical protein
MTVSAGTINVILSDVDLSYLGSANGGTGSIYDSIGFVGGNLMADQADELEVAIFELDMVPVATIMNSPPGNVLSGDFRVNGMGTTLATGYQQNLGSNGGGFGFDLFTTSGVQLRLGIDKFDDFLLTPGPNPVLFLSGTATVLSQQNLPAGLAFDMAQSVTFAYTATEVGVVGSPASGLMASGAMTITGLQVPEPATFGLVVVGLSLGGWALVRRRIK